MKKTFILFSLLLAGVTTFSQSNKEEIEFYQSIFGMEKKAVVAEFISLEGQAANAFWNLYDEYETARKAHGQKRVDLLDRYVSEYEDLDDAKTEALIKEMQALGNDYNKLIQKYYKQILKASGAKAAGQFFQLEAYFQSIIRITLLEQIPFIGEFDI